MKLNNFDGNLNAFKLMNSKKCHRGLIFGHVCCDFFLGGMQNHMTRKK